MNHLTDDERLEIHTIAERTAADIMPTLGIPQDDPRYAALLRDLVSKIITAQMDPISFEGQNCDDYDEVGCMGWDGVSRRCACGNRRVSWALDHNFWIAEAW